MGQSEILDILEREKKPLSRTQIAKFLHQDVTLVSRVIARMIKNESVKIVEISREQAKVMFNCRRRMRMYYV